MFLLQYKKDLKGLQSPYKFQNWRVFSGRGPSRMCQSRSPRLTHFFTSIGNVYVRIIIFKYLKYHYLFIVLLQWFWIQIKAFLNLDPSPEGRWKVGIRIRIHNAVNIVWVYMLSLQSASYISIEYILTASIHIKGKNIHSIVAPILDGNSEIGAHVWNNLCIDLFQVFD